MGEKAASDSLAHVGAPSPTERDGWNEEDHTETDYVECTDARCKNVDANVGFQGMTDVDYPGGTWTPTFGAPKRGNQSVGDDLRAAWKTQLEREGKHDTGGKSLRDVVFGDSPDST